MYIYYICVLFFFFKKKKKNNAHTHMLLKKAVYLLKRDYYHLEVAYRLRGGNPLFAWFKLLMAIIGTSMSVTWIIHIILFMLPNHPITPFLNNLLLRLSIPGFPLFGVACFACYTFWLFFATLKGNFRFGLRFPFCRVYPMDVNDTLMNSFLANSWLMLLCSFAVVQLSATAFPIYARNSSVNLIFGTEIRYLSFFRYFFGTKAFLYALLLFSVVGVISLSLYLFIFFLLLFIFFFFFFVIAQLFWTCIRPRNEAKEVELKLKDIMKGKTNINRRELELVSKK
ncbi:hypothetical protein RFI_13798 [Reticulomyxa filosa]|uniref:Uncharacterized protein n=1 Tax=Reticulomyxa filosa TaxID=46433 RepID=X6NCB0_RETFI|nr:hypothetical protein RFI_13798 [Reticulomyxa filosa]|eukprot:ETO23384.1 hypothetical protein RFI_13798 [Reticulomyxa filosa]